jgi:translocation protein SEC66
MMLRKRLDEIQAQTDAEKEWWEKRRATISEGFMQELGSEKAAAAAKGAGSEEDAVLVDANTPAGTPAGQGKKKKGKK